MSTAILAPALVYKSWRNDGTPNAGGTLYSYEAGSTTPIVTYTDSTAAIPNSNPITLNARGEAPLWVLPNVAYKFVEFDSNGTQVGSQDQVTQQQLLSLYGGVDAGVVNAYILSYSAPYAAYQDGIGIYWIPAHTNTGPSTINVSFNNGSSFAGVKSIVNQDLTALSAGQIVAGQLTFIFYKGGQFLLTTPFGTGGSVSSIVVGSPTGGNKGAGTINVQTAYYLNGVNIFQTGTFTGTLTGCTTSPTGTVYWSIVGNTVTLSIPFLSGTSNATTATITGMPANLLPATQTYFSSLVTTTDNGTPVYTSLMQVGPSGVLVYSKDASGSGTWTAAGTKLIGGHMFTYLLV